MSFWYIDPELFLYAKSKDDVHLWRCKKTGSSLVVPMKFDNFDYVTKVENHLNLVGRRFDWKEPMYQNLVKYISERRFLVNCQGLVIAELQKYGKDGKIDEKESPIYIRSHDVLSLKPYNFLEDPIPLRTVQYLDDINGRAAHVESNSNEQKLQDELNKEKTHNQALKKKVDDLQDQVNTLKKGQGNIVPHESWMNDYTGSNWDKAEALYEIKHPNALLKITGPRNTFTSEDDTTNVRASYFYKIIFKHIGIPMKAVLIEDLTPNKENARFQRRNWSLFKYEGAKYVCRNLSSEDRGLSG